MPYDNLDNAAAAALWVLGKQNPHREHIGALYSTAAGIERTAAVDGGGSSVRGALQVPKGSLAGLYHNHPRDDMRGVFSDTDKAQARALAVPSYISTPSNAFRRFDPSTGKTEDVLAEFPTEEHRRWLMAEILSRKPDDPRGPYR